MQLGFLCFIAVQPCDQHEWLIKFERSPTFLRRNIGSKTDLVDICSPDTKDVNHITLAMHRRAMRCHAMLSLAPPSLALPGAAASRLDGSGLALPCRATFHTLVSCYSIKYTVCCVKTQQHTKDFYDVTD
jgi:hypothetical protein